MGFTSFLKDHNINALIFSQDIGILQRKKEMTENEELNRNWELKMKMASIFPILKAE